MARLSLQTAFYARNDAAEKAILGHVSRDPALAALVAILGETGMRKGEALNLQRSKIDRKNCRIIIEKGRVGQWRGPGFE